MKKSMVKTLTSIGVATVMMGTMAMPAFAEGNNQANSETSAVISTTEEGQSFEKEIKKPTTVQTPAVTIKFNVTEAEEADLAKKPQGQPVKKGPLSALGTPSDNKIELSATFTSKDEDVKKSSVTSNVSFTFDESKLTDGYGIYRYVITEQSVGRDGLNGYNENSTATGKDETEYTPFYLDVILSKKTTTDGAIVVDASGKPVNEVNYYLVDTTKSTSEEYIKTSKITNQYIGSEDVVPDDRELKLKKTVTGTQASDTDVFDFIVKIDNVKTTENSQKYVLVVPKSINNSGNAIASTETGKKTIADLTSIDIVDEKNNYYSFTENDNIVIYLKHNEEIKIEGVTEQDDYEIVESVTTLQSMGYGDPTISGSDNAAISGAPTTVSGKGGDNIEYVNIKNAVTPTGVVLTFAPYAMMVAAAGALSGLFLSKKKREEF